MPGVVPAASAMAPGGSGQTGHPAPLGRTGVLAVRIAPVVPTDAPDVPPVVTLAVIWASSPRFAGCSNLFT